MRKSILMAAFGAMLVPSMPVLADPPGWASAHGRRAHDRDEARYHRYDAAPRYDRYGRYATPQRLHPDDRIWRGRDGRYYCRRDNGTTGLIIGAAAGALLGRALDGGQDQTVGTILGAAGGALLGREIDRGELRCR